MASRINQRFASAEEVRDAFEQAYQQMSATRALPPTSGLDALSIATQAKVGNAPYMRDKQSIAPAPGADPKQEVATLQRTEDVPSSSNAFSPEDYDAPTTAVGASQIAGRGHTEQVSTGRPPLWRGGRQRRGPWVGIFCGPAFAGLLTKTGTIIFWLQFFSTASIHFFPHTPPFLHLFHIQTKPLQK